MYRRRHRLGDANKTACIESEQLIRTTDTEKGIAIVSVEAIQISIYIYIECVLFLFGHSYRIFKNI